MVLNALIVVLTAAGSPLVPALVRLRDILAAL